MPGISDHDAITFHFDINKHPTSSVKQYKAPLYHKGNIELIKQGLAAFANNFLSIASDPQTRSVEQLWQEFNQAVQKAVSKHICLVCPVAWHVT